MPTSSKNNVCLHLECKRHCQNDGFCQNIVCLQSQSECLAVQCVFRTWPSTASVQSPVVRTTHHPSCKGARCSQRARWALWTWAEWHRWIIHNNTLRSYSVFDCTFEAVIFSLGRQNKKHDSPQPSRVMSMTRLQHLRLTCLHFPMKALAPGRSWTQKWTTIHCVHEQRSW